MRANGRLKSRGSHTKRGEKKSKEGNKEPFDTILGIVAVLQTSRRCGLSFVKRGTHKRGRKGYGKVDRATNTRSRKERNFQNHKKTQGAKRGNWGKKEKENK